MSKRHREAMAHLLYGTKEGGGFVQLTGEVGTGKTTICRCLLMQLPESIDVALILNPQIDQAELMATLCDELHIKYPRNATPKVQLDVLNHFLLKTYAEGRRAVLIIDEAQLLTREVLEQVRILTNLETTKHKLLQIILIGQPELAATLNRSDLTQLAQRITARYHLHALNARETKEYVKHRLTVVGRQNPLFTNTALRYVHKYSKGVPRLINVICDRALLGAYSKNASRVSAPLVRKAAKEVLSAPKPRRERWSVLFAPALGLIAVVAVSVWLWQFRQEMLDRVERAESLAQARTASQSATGTIENGTDMPPGSSELTSAELGTVISEKESPSRTETEMVPEVQVAWADSSGIEESEVVTMITETESPSIQETDTELLEQPEPPIAHIEPEAIAAESEASREEPVQPGISEVLEPSASDYQRVFASMVKRWEPRYLTDGAPLDCPQVEPLGLACLNKQGNWMNLRNYNRIALLHLRHRGEVYPALLTGLGEDEVTLEISGTEYVYPISDVEKYWYGKFTLLWRPPALQYAVIGSASKGPDVLWLRQALNRVAREDGLGSNVDELNSSYDEELRERVMLFQKTHDLDADGVVGADTLIHLNTILNEPDIPLLAQAPKS